MATLAAESRLTQQQQRAIETRDVSVSLSAGAGCGKTHVLVERYLSHLEPAAGAASSAARLSRLIAITFTERAAREMRDRVRRACRRRLQDAADEADAQHWLHLLRELETARVSTIHSFCSALLRGHAVEARIDPHFITLEAAQSATLRSEVIDDELRRQLGERSTDLIELVVMFGLDSVRTMAAALLDNRQLDYAAWEGVSPQELVERWQAFERERVMPVVLGRLFRSRAAHTVLTVARGGRASNAVMAARFDELLELLPRIEQCEQPTEHLRRIHEAAKVQGGGPAKTWPSEEIHGQFKEAAEQLRGEIKSLQSRLGIGGAGALASAEAALQLLRVARSISAAYAVRKRELAVLDFDDLLIGAYDLLTGPHGQRLRKQLASQLELLLVDEFQDTDRLQVDLIETLCGDPAHGGKLFFVGDAKQSIYRFRGADPAVFRELRAKIPPAGKLPLTENFRSQPAILDFVNALFCDRLGPDYEPLVAHRQNLGQGPCVEFLWATADEDQPATTVSALRRIEADWIARRLAALLNDGVARVRDKQADPEAGAAARAARLGDVAILLRALSDVQFYEEALRRYGIPYYVVGGHAFYAQQEIYDLLNLLRWLAFGDELSLAGALRSPFFSLADETLFWLARGDGGMATTLFTAELPGQLDPRQARRVRRAAATLAELRVLKDRLPIADLVGEVLTRTGYDAILLAEFLGERKLANLRKLVEQARGFDAAGIFTLPDYVAQLADLVAKQPDEAPAAIEPETSDVVRLMSIHQAKGLEFPLVVVPDLERRPRGSTAQAAFHPELGPLVTARSADLEGASGLDLYKLLEQEEDEAEQLRILYVATTRAADYLILSSGVESLAEPKSPWLRFLAERFDLSSGALRAALPPEYRRPIVAVTSVRPAVPTGVVPQPRRPDLDEIVAGARTQAAAGAGEWPASIAAIPADRSARRVFSFSALSGLLEPVADDQSAGGDGVPRPRSASDPLRLGTLVHAVLAQLDFRGTNDVAAMLDRERGRDFDLAPVDLAAAGDMIERFLRSPTGAALGAARQVHTEVEFLLAWPPGEFAADGTLIHGFIDCLFEDPRGEWRVLDFKTNAVAAAGVPGAAVAYEAQLRLYGLAVRDVLGRRPAGLSLYFLQPGVEQPVAWDEAAEHETVSQVAAALAAWRAQGAS